MSREEDYLVEQQVSQRIDQYLINRNIQFERIRDKERQVKGIDLILFSNGKKANVDEKAKYKDLQYEGQQLWNYSFELSRCCRDGKRRIGWFLDPHNETDIICYAFPKFNDPEDVASGIKPNMRVEWFMKKDVMDIVKRELTVKQLYEESQKLASDYSTSRISHKWFGLYRTNESRLWEEPVNLIITRGLIWKTPSFHVANV